MRNVSFSRQLLELIAVLVAYGVFIIIYLPLSVIVMIYHSFGNKPKVHAHA